MTPLLEKALEQLKALPTDAQEEIAYDLLEMIRSEAKWDQLFADARSEAVLKRLADEANADETFDCDPVTRTSKSATP